MIKIYAIRNKENGMVYVGCTAANINKRMREHRCLLNQRRHAAPGLQADWNQVGEAGFEIVILEQLPPESSVVEKRVAELYWMQHFNHALYNLNQTSFAPTKEAIKKGVAASAKSDFRNKPENLVKRKEVAERTLNRPEVRAKNAERLKHLWQDPEFRAKRLEGLDRGRSKTNAARKAARLKP